jgi:hypothetical protein
MGTAVTFHMACRANILGTEMALEKELALYEKMKADLLKNHEGKFVLIRGDEFLGAFDSAENAYGEGVKRFGRESFLVKKVTTQEEVYRNQALNLGLINARI